MLRPLLSLLLSVVAMLPAVAAAQGFDPVTAAMEELVAGHDLPGASLRVNKQGEVVTNSISATTTPARASRSRPPASGSGR